MANSFSLALIGLITVSWAALVDAQMASKHARNSVVEYLENAELQVETDAQRREIQRALSDMLDKSTAELRTRKYADYQGTPNTWTIPRLLIAYFVPRTPQNLESKRFYEDVSKPEAKVAIRHKLDEIGRALKQSRH
jgi:hypothetical protein